MSTSCALRLQREPSPDRHDALARRGGPASTERMTLQAFLTAARGCAHVFVIAAVLVLTVGTTAAVQHVHVDDEEEHCSLCAICGVEEAGTPAPASTPRFAASAAPIGSLDQRVCPTPLRAYRARAPPLSH